MAESSFQRLVQLTLLGTERQSITMPGDAAPLSNLLAQLDLAQCEQTLLSAAALTALHERAGQSPGRDAGPLPNCVLIEGPPDAQEVLALAAHANLKPPVALLCYDPEKPQRAVYYPFAAFSPEWQAIQFGLKRKLPVRFIDLPQSIQMGIAAIKASQTPIPIQKETNRILRTAVPNQTQRRPTVRHHLRISASIPSPTSLAPPAIPTASVGGSNSSNVAAAARRSFPPSSKR